MKTENILFKSMLMHTHMAIQVVRLFSSVSPQVFGQRGAVSKSTGAPREHILQRYGRSPVCVRMWVVTEGSAHFNICRKALGHLMTFTQRSVPYRFGLAG